MRISDLINSDKRKPQRPKNTINSSMSFHRTEPDISKLHINIKVFPSNSTSLGLTLLLLSLPVLLEAQARLLAVSIMKIWSQSST